ncbi:MAG: Ldh family oxidoreductase [Gammaproteobacteria bacterium]|nr:Ldh family oxidoreductase [Gammaproteobacteria bacterium]
MSDEVRHIAVADLQRFISRCFVAAGIEPAPADTVAALMAEADAFGSDGHGVFRLPQYVQRIRDGGINTRPHIEILRETTAMALVEGDNALGHLVMHFAAQLAIRKAREHGIAWVGTRYSNHAGPAGLYARMPLAEDMIGLYLAVGSANHLPPWGGTEMLLSTNPIAAAIPALEEDPIVLDMATTVAAYGKVKTKAQRGEPLPEGWMIDREGQPLTDPQRANDGFLLPIGGAKGYGLSLVFGLLAGTLNGAAFGRDVVDFNADSHTVTNTGQAMLAISLQAFGDPLAFKRSVDGIVRDMRASPKLPGVDEIRLPGERSWKIHRERTAEGVPLNAALLQRLEQLANELGVDGPV